MRDSRVGRGATQGTKFCAYFIVYNSIEYMATDFSKYARAPGSSGAKGKWMVRDAGGLGSFREPGA